MNSKYYFYVKVIEAKNVVMRTTFYQSEPFVSIKVNGHEFFGNKRTTYHTGVEWWDKIFRFSLNNFQFDWITVEVREKGYHIIRSDWLGEIQIKVKDFADGAVHQKWFQLGGGIWKHHSRKPRGCIQLAFQLIKNKMDRPFITLPAEPVMTYNEWRVVQDWPEYNNFFYSKKPAIEANQQISQPRSTLSLINEPAHRVAIDTPRPASFPQEVSNATLVPTNGNLIDLSGINKTSNPFEDNNPFIIDPKNPFAFQSKDPNRAQFG